MLIAGETVSGVGTSMSILIDSALSLVQSVFVPTTDSDAVQKLRVALATDGMASRVRVIPDPDAKESYCYQNVQSKVELEGGRMQLGWAVWQHSNLFIEAEPHAVFDTGSGRPWIDPTPNSFPDGTPCGEILFIPNDGASYNFENTVIPDNIRVPLVDDPRVSEALRLSSEKITLLNQVPKEWVSGELIYHYPPALWLEVQQVGARIGMLLAAASSRSQLSKSPKKIGRNSSCPCNSGKKYKRCCGK
jgi:SEC-C motif